MLASWGFQDAVHKQTAPSISLGPWAGSVTHTEGEVSLLISQKKWGKVKELVSELKSMLGKPSVDQKHLEQMRWHPGQDQEEYQMHQGGGIDPLEWAEDTWEAVLGTPTDDVLSPELVTPVPYFPSDVKALTSLTVPAFPPTC
ncbi:hypothetical protein ACHAW6_003982 [Cyclotella cf. meneghiniana]